MNPETYLRAVRFVKEREGYRSRAYKDTVFQDTIGYGFLMSDSRIQKELKAEGFTDPKTQTLSKEASDRIFHRILPIYIEKAKRRVGEAVFAAQPEGVQIALISMAYNNPDLIGAGLARALNRGDFEMADWEIRHNTSNKKNPDLLPRRNLEADLFKAETEKQRLGYTQVAESE
jgi:GH24 family phage-related lysozyme (muramidase)